MMTLVLDLCRFECYKLINIIANLQNEKDCSYEV